MATASRIPNGMVRRPSQPVAGYKRHTEEAPMELHTIGIDLGKTVFHLVGLNLRGEVVVRKKFSRLQLLRFMANRRVHVFGMGDRGGAPALCRARRRQEGA